MFPALASQSIEQDGNDLVSFLGQVLSLVQMMMVVKSSRKRMELVLKTWGYGRCSYSVIGFISTRQAKWRPSTSRLSEPRSPRMLSVAAGPASRLMFPTG